jgi:cyclopropane fatty-acyl-phospholipid synthase-like methyltransferase
MDAAHRNPGTALDVGCGAGSFSIALALAGPVAVTALDIDEVSVERAKSSAGLQCLKGSITFEAFDAGGYSGPSFDIVACIGASQAFGTPRQALSRCRELLNSDGLLVFAELVWAAPPPGAFLEFLGCEADLFWSEQDGPSELEMAGYKMLKQVKASAESWRSFEHATLTKRLQQAETLPAANRDAAIARAQEWFGIYEKFGSESFGFVAYLAEAKRG